MDLQETRAEPASPPSAHTLASLAAMSVDELPFGRLYARGVAPASLAALDGHPRAADTRGARSFDAGLAADALRRLSGAAAFPWGGKSFTSRDAGAGAGVQPRAPRGSPPALPLPHAHRGRASSTGGPPWCSTTISPTTPA